MDISNILNSHQGGGKIPVTEYRNPGSTAPYGSQVYANWVNLNNIKMGDGVTARVDLRKTGNSSYSDPIILFNYGFNLPNNAKINEIKIKVICKQSGTAKMVRIERVGWKKANQDPSYLSQSTYISNTLKGYEFKEKNPNITASDLNDSNFGVVVQFRNSNQSYTPTAYLDTVQISVDYTLQGANEPGTPQKPITQSTPEMKVYMRGLEYFFTYGLGGWSNRVIKAMLCSSNYTPDQTHQNTQHVNGEISGGNYQTGGYQIQNTLVKFNPSENELLLCGDPLDIPLLTGTFRTIVIYDDTLEYSKPLLAYFKFPENITLNAERLVIKWDNGVIIKFKGV